LLELGRSLFFLPVSFFMPPQAWTFFNSLAGSVIAGRAVSSEKKCYIGIIQ
jgi:hypothetical protein